MEYIECDTEWGGKVSTPILTIYRNGHMNFNAAAKKFLDGHDRMRVLWNDEYAVIKLVPTNDGQAGRKIVRSKTSSPFICCAAIGKYLQRFFGPEDHLIRAQVLQQENGELLVEIPKN